VNLLLRLIPKPDVACIVDADPEAAHLRKPEYPLEFVRTNRDAYIALSRVVRHMTVLEPLPVEEAKSRIKELVARRCLRRDFDLIDFPLPYPAGPHQAKTPNA
ncbi:MAG TPA: hypothetical protein VNS62_11535, partial [Candidatus Udaeobacter sp.]|nr:hypothetical protein [Candidatus Udaeobacter sp.]